MKTRILRVVAVLVASVLVLGALTGAAANFTDPATAYNNTFTTGTADLKFFDGTNYADDLDPGITKDCHDAGVYPGWDYMYDEVVLANQGTLDLDVFMNASITDDMFAGTSGKRVSELLTLEIYEWNDTDNDGNAEPGEAGDLLFDGTLYELATGSAVAMGVIEDVTLNYNTSYGNPASRAIAPNPKGYYVNWSLASTGNDADDNTFQNFVLKWDATFLGIADPGIQCPSW